MRADKALLLAWGLILVAAVGWPFLLPGEYLWRDMALLHDPALTPGALGSGALPARNVPQDALLALAGGPWIARVLILGAAGCAAATAALWAASPWTAAGAMACAVANPFVIERLLQGQWSLAIAAWLLPVIAYCGLRGHERSAWLAMCVASITPTGAVFAVLTALFCARTRVGLAGLVLWLPWAIPGIMQAQTGSVTGSARTAVEAFSPHAEHLVGTAGALIGLGGIWNSQAVPDSRTAGFALAGLGVAALAVLGAFRLVRREAQRLGALALMGMGAALALWLCPGVAVWLVENVPGAGLVRDSQKLVMLAIPLYVAGLGALPRGFAPLAVACTLLQNVDAPRALGVLAPTDTGVDRALVAEIDDRTALFVDRPYLVEVTAADGTRGVAIDPYSKVTAQLSSGQLSVDGDVVDQAAPAYLAALAAWDERDMAQLEKLGVGVVVLDGRIVASTPAPPPALPWAPMAGWLISPLLALVLRGAPRSACPLTPKKR
ncbi:hypothetical protein [Corynebacterium flavescens]|uniref:hypothetical protein n=1 Tax=Corynebacterium flavescens TaxID=28028 RepID=UPI000EC21ED4|nr:hypothetical protein [Corynebacterium flavescens]